MGRKQDERRAFRASLERAHPTEFRPKYSEDQPRDEAGRFGEGGGGAGGSGEGRAASDSNAKDGKPWRQSLGQSAKDHEAFRQIKAGTVIVTGTGKESVLVTSRSEGGKSGYLGFAASDKSGAYVGVYTNVEGAINIGWGRSPDEASRLAGEARATF